MALCLVLGMSTIVCIAESQRYANLPDDWELLPPKGQMIRTGTMPQGASASPDGKTLAVISSGFNQPALMLYRAGDLRQLASIPLTGAFGRPLWIDQSTVLVAGANADAIFKVDVLHRAVQTIPLGKGSYPTSIARAKRMVAVATDGTLSVKIGPLNDLGDARSVLIGGHVGGLSFSSDGLVLYASNRSSNYVDAIDVKSLRISKIGADLHPSDVLTVGSRLYIAETAADAVGLYDIRSGRLKQIFVGDEASGTRLSGVSPNALAFEGNTLFVSLGAANSIALVRNGRVAGRAPAGWYPTDVVPIGNRLYVIDGKGEGTTPNPYFRAQAQGFHGYIGTIEFGSIRMESLSRDAPSGNPQGSRGWGIAVRNTVVRPDGPIRHVFFVLKENRSYDQVLGDVAAGNGDPKLAWFGMPVTSNEHELASQFGLFDNAYTSGEVSEAGHDWSDAAFVDDYVQRTWPLNYANRGNSDFSFPGILAIVPKNGYIWQDAFRHGVSFRDYGEMTNIPDVGVRTLKDHYDKRYKPFDLKYSDVDRVGEWRREFEKFLSAGNLPQFELIWLANDHTAGSKPGFLTPRALVAQNDYATGLVVDAISHSRVWKSSAIFIIEDDSQDGPDHVSDQRTTMFVASAYSRGGVLHRHYSTVSVLRTMEIILGLPPLSTYDAMAVPLYAAFSSTPSQKPFNAIKPKIDITATNQKTAYGAALSSRLDFTRPDANRPGVLLDILAHNHNK